MYQYNEIDQTIVDERVAQYRDQTRRFLAGELTEEQFRPLRLMNGLYIQTHAPMLRVAIPYGLLNTKQVRMLAHIADKYDKGYGHVSTRQNMQYNWPTLESVPDILADLASVQMHAIQTSGNCIRNVTTDELAGVAQDEVIDPRAYCEIIRQWSTFHPEFAYLPRKFKIAVSGSVHDRAATKLHDIGIYIHQRNGQIGFEILVGGGLGRTPVIGKTINNWVETEDLLTYLEAILRVYNLHGRRDNKYKARIKILVNALGIEAFKSQVEAEFEAIRDSSLKLDMDRVEQMLAHFAPPSYDLTAAQDTTHTEHLQQADFATWVKYNTKSHKVDGYRNVYISLKEPGKAPGDVTAAQLNAIADLADQYAFGEVRTTHNQNMVIPDIQQKDLLALWQQLDQHNLSTANIGTLNDMICCPGLDFCSLANASSLNIARQINDKFDQMDYLYDLGEIFLNMSGCMNACGHHHIGHIGILGVDKKGEQWYQISLGGSPDGEAALGKVLGPSVAQDKVADTMEKIITVYTDERMTNERFIDTYQRIGIKPFKDRVYA